MNLIHLPSPFRIAVRFGITPLRKVGLTWIGLNGFFDETPRSKTTRVYKAVEFTNCIISLHNEWALTCAVDYGNVMG